MKKKILITFREDGQNGGPYNSHLRILESKLKQKYEFAPLIIPKGRLKILNPKLTKNLVSQIKKTNPDIVHFTGLELIGFHVALACKLAKVKKTIVAIHGSSSESIEISKSIIKKYTLRILEYLTLKSSKYSYGVSNYIQEIDVVKKNAQNYYGTIYNIVNIKNISETKYKIRESHKIGDKKLIITSAGRIEKEKGYEVIKDIIIKNNNENIVFLIIGNGSYLEKMRSELNHEENSGKVIFTGYQPNAIDIMKQSDIFIMASLHETLCMALAEAGISGCALIANEVGGMREIISNNENGYLIKDNKIDDYNEKINFLEKNRGELYRLRKNSKNLLEKKFDTDKILNQITEMYEDVLCKD